jgi:alpha-tubulin suppressor-like RCC1 family protein
VGHHPTPSLLPGVTATAITVGNFHTCVLVTGGGVKCWGDNQWGQLGIGSIVQQNSPVNVGHLSGLCAC